MLDEYNIDISHLCHMPAMCVEFCWMGNAEIQILAAAFQEIARGTVGDTSAVSSRPDSLSSYTRDAARLIRNNQTRLHTAGTFRLPTTRALTEKINPDDIMH